MAQIYLKHPVHGAKIATLELEAEYDEQNGWVRYDPAAPPQPVVNTLVPPPATRRGRPPKIKD